MVENPAFLPRGLFSDIEKSTKILYDIRNLKLFAVYSVYIDNETVRQTRIG